MSTEVFPFRFLDEAAGGDYAGNLVSLDEMETSQGGFTAVVARASRRQFVAAGTLILPDIAGYDASDFWAFWDARSGRVDTFLFKAQEVYLRMVSGEAAGTHGGGAGADFALDMRHIDSATLVVKVAGVIQTLTTDYTFSGNNTAPKITSTANLDSGAVTFDYEYYMPVRFAMDRPEPRILRHVPKPAWADQEAVALGVSMIESRAGRRFV